MQTFWASSLHRRNSPGSPKRWSRRGGNLRWGTCSAAPPAPSGPSGSLSWEVGRAVKVGLLNEERARQVCSSALGKGATHVRICKRRYMQEHIHIGTWKRTYEYSPQHMQPHKYKEIHPCAQTQISACISNIRAHDNALISTHSRKRLMHPHSHYLLTKRK